MLVKITGYYVHPHSDLLKKEVNQTIIPISRIHKIYSREDGYYNLVLVGEKYMDKIIIDSKDFESIFNSNTDVKLSHANEKMKEALRFYADEDSYGPVFDFKVDPPIMYKTGKENTVIIDGGAKARQVLREVDATSKEDL